ncbi:hypothetical protein HDV57DRAFT_497221 [Trichoderma longibrachiatum]
MTQRNDCHRKPLAFHLFAYRSASPAVATNWASLLLLVLLSLFPGSSNLTMSRFPYLLCCIQTCSSDLIVPSSRVDALTLMRLHHKSYSTEYGQPCHLSSKVSQDHL